MRTRDDIEHETMFMVENGSSIRLDMAILELPLDIRDQNERIISLLKSINDRDEDVLTGRRGRA